MNRDFTHNALQLKTLKNNVNISYNLVSTFGVDVFNNFSDVIGCDLMLMHMIYNAKMPWCQMIVMALDLRA